jgi:CheY-like chemotaxis protein
MSVPSRILVVEDQPDVRDVIVLPLRDEGYAVSEAGNADEALRILQTTAFDLLITDVVMPGAMNGFALASAARRLQPGIKVVCVTGYSREETPDKHRGECDLIVHKPFRISTFLDTVAKLLGR